MSGEPGRGALSGEDVRMQRTAGTSTSTMAMTPDDQARATALRKMQHVALGLLIVVAVVYAVARWAEDDGDAWSYVRAFAEAAMVGALADWFAVTALFRHPLGLKIPHTAIIPERKAQLGSSLGQFV